MNEPRTTQGATGPHPPAPEPAFQGSILSTSTPQPSLRETFEPVLGPDLATALEQKGFERLTPVQEAVLRPELSGRDLRISSQTGSGKTVAIGLTIREDVARPEEEEAAEDGATDASGNVKGRDQRARPRALVVTPTRELAKQVEEELSWLYAPLRKRVASVTGGGGYRDELRAFRAKPAVIVGTPGRLLDHLKRGAIDATDVGSVVFDEADRMLDLGFRDDLEAILGHLPEERRTHLVSATFPREVRALADSVQKDPVPVEGTPLGTANLDIEHVIHLVRPNERLAAIINLLLENPDTQSLVFARTRADVADIADALGQAGFNIAMLSGEMEQAERNRALHAFKRGNVDALVATDVAARGIDVQDVGRVIHAEPPTDADAYTHRSGRTGRAGRKGTSSLLVSERELPRTISLLGRARVRWSYAPLPTAESLRESADEKLFTSLTADFIEGEAIDERSLSVAERILTSPEPARAVGRLVALAVRRSRSEPQEITPIAPPTARAAGAARRKEFGRQDYGAPPSREYAPRDRGPREPGPREHGDGAWVPFRISWGESHGAEPRRLVAMMCRRGNISGRDIGAIRVGRTSSVIEVSSQIADEFEQLTSKPDPRDPRVLVRRWTDEQPERKPRHVAHSERRERPAAARPTEERAAEDRPSTRSVSKERASARELPKDRPSVRETPKDRASAREMPKDRPSARSVPKDRPSARSVPNDRPSVREAPKDRPATPHKGYAPQKDRRPHSGPPPKGGHGGGHGGPAKGGHGPAKGGHGPAKAGYPKKKPFGGGHAPPKRRGPPR